MVDFNKLNKELNQYHLDDKVHYIIDHHVDSQLYSNTTLKGEKII